MPYVRERNHDKQIAYLRKRADRFLILEKFLNDFAIYDGQEWMTRRKIIRSSGLRIIGRYPEMKIHPGRPNKEKERDQRITRYLTNRHHKGYINLCDFNEWETEIGVVIKRGRKATNPKEYNRISETI